MAKPLMQSETIQRKEYVYTLGTVQLKFTLRTDVKAELKAWKELMEKAMVDVKADLEALG